MKEDYIIKQAEFAKSSSVILSGLDSNTKNKAILNMAEAILKNRDKIILENKKDAEEAIKSKLNESLLKRLILDDDKINDMVNGLRDVAKLDNPVGKILEQTEIDEGLILYKVSCPIGVIGVVFESRPDAIPQIISLCIKSGNSVLLKGGIEARHSNKILFDILRKSAEAGGIPKNSIQMIETREQVAEMLKLGNYIDLLIPRGSNKFVKYIKENTKIPVLGHSEGICHVYVDRDADIKKAFEVCIDSKCQYPAACNSMETLLINKDIIKKFLPVIANFFLNANVELRLDSYSLKALNNSDKSILKNNRNKIKKAEEKDWGTEYSDLILSIKIVNDAEEAIGHINKFGSRHTDSIITENKETAEKFMSLVDSSSVMWNCSTRFADGYRYGKGAEVGISTAKIHSRGPVGLEGLIIYKYKLVGSGQIVKDYTVKNPKKYIHRKIRDN